MLLGLVALVATATGLVFLIRGFVNYLASLNSEVAKTLLPASVAVIGSIVAVAVGKVYEVSAGVRKELRDRKTPVYEELVTKLFSLMFAEKRGEKQMSEQEFMIFFTHATEKLIIWGADDVLLKFNRFRKGAGEMPRMLFLFEDLLVAIRRDLGHNNRNFKKGSVLGLFINDIDDFVGKSA
jgi:hypothetical protein